MILKLILSFAIFFPFLAAPALAEEVTSCEDGKVLVTFADGNTVSTMCVDPGTEMEPTVATQTEGEEDQDNYD